MVSVQLQRKIKRFQDEATSFRTMAQLGKFAERTLVKRVKAGFGVSKDKKQLVRLKSLSLAYKRQRRGLVQFTTKGGKKVKFKVSPPDLGEFASPGKSNLTLTGQMLRAIGKSISNGRITLSILNSTRRDPNKKKQLTNKQVAEFVSKDREFFALTEGEQRIIIAEYRKILKALAKRIF